MAGEVTVPENNADVALIQRKICCIRQVQVMLDRDLAELYGVEVKYLNRQVKRNIERFPADFMFRLSKEDCSRCQIGTLKGGRGEHSKYLPYAFTENGIAMLSGVLRSETAIVDGKEIYSIGASLKDAGRLTFGVVKSGAEAIPGLLANLRNAATSSKTYG